MGDMVINLPLAKKPEIEKTANQLTKESLLLQSQIIEDQATIDAWYKQWGTTLQIPTNRIAENKKRLEEINSLLKEIYAKERAAKDIIDFEKLTAEAAKLKDAILTPAERLVKIQARYTKMLDKGLITLKEYEKAIDMTSIFKPLIDMLAEGIISAKEFENAMNEIGKGGQKEIDAVVASITEFKNLITDIKDRIANVGLSDLEARIQKIKEQGKIKFGIDIDEFLKGEKKVKAIVKDLESQVIQPGIDIDYAKLEELQNQLESIARTASEPAEKVQKLISAIATAWEAGLITEDEFFVYLKRINDELGKFSEIEPPEGFREFADDIKHTEALLAQLTRKEYLAKIKDEADALKESLKGPTERINDMRERLAEMLAQGFISTEEFDKGLEKARRDIGGLGDIGSGRFQEIRSEFIDVAALNAGSKQTEAQKNNRLTEETNDILRSIAREGKGVFPA